MIKKTILAAFVVSTLAIFGFSGCIKPNHVRTGLDVLKVACILAEQNVDDEHFVAKACDIADDYIDEVRDLLKSKKIAAQKIAAKQSDADAETSGDAK